MDKACSKEKYWVNLYYNTYEGVVCNEHETEEEALKWRKTADGTVDKTFVKCVEIEVEKRI